MTFKQFISDQKWLIFTFSLILLIISIVISVDPALHVTLDNLLYLVSLSTIMFCVYFIGSYFHKEQQLQKWKQFVIDDIGSYPEAKTFEQQVYVQSFNHVGEIYLKQIQTSNEAAKEQLEFMTQWFHEIKTPIAVSRLLLETEVESPSLQEEMNRIEGYVEQALYFSRLHEFNKDYLLQEIDLEKLIKEIVMAESKTFISKKIKVEMPKINVTVLSDKKALTYIIRQLLLNSLKYTGEHGQISLSLHPESKQFVLHDNGSGIPAEDLPRVFEKGFTGKNGRTHQRSTGMGLYLAKKTAEKLGHELSISSKVGVYTTAIITFPERDDSYFKM
ncbi:histidine kinase [Neobacillus bataviensis LMG 21833]|uniref:histidine kinase n=1 Tax=Neobacillus bataviensis LMG 21833 TaxID=1117379 RepID=K6CZ87_9BACI|nr:sensor histidine kinase [Neobacillus bataviensis]EKN65527.1 histidine kinase [Neobacillus bataviensis LMG 21833]